MSQIGLVIDITTRFASAPIRGFVSTWEKMATVVRRSMRTFRDITIVFYGMRRGFDLVSRAIKGSFAAAGGVGVSQLEALDIAWQNMSASFGRAIQKTNAWKMAFEGVAGSLRSGMDEDKVARFIDKVIVGLLGIGKVVVAIVGAFAGMLNGLGTIFNAVNKFFSGAFSKNNPFKAMADDVQLQIVAMRNATERGEDFNQKLMELIDRKNELLDLSEGRNADIFGKFNLQGYKDAIKFFGELQEKLLGVRDIPIVQDTAWENFLARLQTVTQAVKGLGSEWVTTFSNFGEQLMSKGETSGSFRNFGKAAGDTFRKQFSQAVFSPLEQSFQMLADAAAIPFRVVGAVLQELIVAPMAKAVSGAITGFVGEYISAQAAMTGATLASQGAVVGGAVGGALAVTQAWAPAAAGASISTLGAALIFGGLATAAMLVAANNFMAEGGVVMPRPGGVPAILGEGGQPEVVLPLDKAQDVLGGMSFGGGIKVVVYGDLKSRAANRALARDLGRQIHDEGKSTSYGQSRRRRV